MKRPVRILLICDDERPPCALERLLAGRQDLATFESATGAAALERLVERHHDLCFLNLDPETRDGLGRLDAVRGRASETPIVVLTRSGDERFEDAAISHGAADCMRHDELDERSLRRCIRLARRRREHLDALRASEERFRRAVGSAFDDVCDRDPEEDTFWFSRFALLESLASDGVFDWNLSSGHAYYSPRWKATLGYEEDELDATPNLWRQLVHPDDVPTLELALSEHIERDRPLATTVRFHHKSGETVWILVRGAVTRNDTGDPVRLIGTHTDVTALKNAAPTSPHDVGALAGEGPALRALVDLKTGKLVACNDALARLLGRRAEELAGAGLVDIHDPTSATRIREALERLECVKEVRDVELLLTSGSGGVRDVSLRLTKLSRDGRVHARATWSDISRRKEVERRLVTFARELERSNRELQEFAYVASHDLREPLRMVSSYLQLLEQRYADSLDQDARDFIGFAVDGARRMRELITDLLEYSRIGHTELSRQAVETRDVVNQVLADLAPAIEDAGATIEVGDLPRITADPTHVRRVFQNLIANALKFRSTRAPVISIQGEPYGVDWMLTVTDNGIGIPHGDRERVFQVFKRLHATDRYGGTGVGLAICKKTIERHGGRIRVEPVPGGGSRFSFTIPRVETVTDDARRAA